jgi:hypothetical protein
VVISLSAFGVASRTQGPASLGPSVYRPPVSPSPLPDIYPSSRHSACTTWRTAADRVEDDADPGLLPTVLEPTRSGPFRSATAARLTTRASLAEPARAAPPHPPCPDARGGGDAAEVLAEVGRRLDVGPELTALVLVAVAVEDAPIGRRDRDALAEWRTVTLGNLDMSL